MLRAKVAKLEARLRELEVEHSESSSSGGTPALSPEPSCSSSSPDINLYMPMNGPSALLLHIALIANLATASVVTMSRCPALYEHVGAVRVGQPLHHAWWPLHIILIIVLMALLLAVILV